MSGGNTLKVVILVESNLSFSTKTFDIIISAETCVNDNSTLDVHNYDCSHYDAEPEDCAGGLYDTDDFVARKQCCACGGGKRTPQQPQINKPTNKRPPKISGFNFFFLNITQQS